MLMAVQRLKKLIGRHIPVSIVAVALLAVTNLHASETVRYDEAKLKAVMQRYIEANMPWSKGDLRIVYPVKPSALDIPGDRITHEVVTKLNDGYIGDGLFAIRFYNRGYLVREEPVRLVMEVAREVVVSDKVLNRDRIVKIDDVHLAKKWFKQIPLNVLSELGEVVGKRMSMSIRPNVEITRNMLKEPIMVKRGKMVKIVLDTGPMQIAALGLSEEDGMQGAVIRVKNISSRKTIYARVLGESLVGVEF
jgi:flagella basal body P-ring formation protein FlgA